MVDDGGKRPLWFSRPDGDLFAFAGIWAELPRKGSDEVLHSCALVTTEPNALMRPVHDRMPVILDPAVEALWLDPDADPQELMRLLTPPPEDFLVAREVPDLVNDVREDGPELIDAADRGAGRAVLDQAGARGGAGGLVLAVERPAADRALLLDLPVLVEADHRDHDQDQLHGDEDQR